MSEISRLATTDKDIVDMWSVIIKIVYTLIAGAIGGACTFWWNRKKYLLAKQKLEHEIESSRAKIEADKKLLRQQMITNNIAPMRQAWINNVRSQISEIIATSDFTRTYLHDFKSDDKMFEDERERLKLVVEHGSNAIRALHNIKLLLPINESDYSLLIGDLKELSENIISNSLNKTDRDNLVDKITNDSRKLLKKEWEVTKSLKEIE
ncbi:hypothetical protein [Providencia sp. PROV129]|uniref:hypothetical protein n=1 Tax=Providencia sp. PROV129 TaxID=2949839 RepID=UPI00234A2632|nr:hypothetical protein [Providencia sp. PROV129]